MGNKQSAPTPATAAPPAVAPHPRPGRTHVLWDLDSARIPDGVPIEYIAEGVLGIARACGTLVTIQAFGSACIAPRLAAALGARGIDFSFVSNEKPLEVRPRVTDTELCVL